MNIEPIGHLRTCFGSKFGVPRQPGLCPSAWGILHFSGNYRSTEAIRGLEGFSHLWLIFGFHATAAEGWHPTVRPPRLGGNQRVGVFASRSTYRPNSLGLSLVKLDSISLKPDAALPPPLLHLSGIDLIDGTPIFDIKPYLPFVESIPHASCGYATPPISRLSVKIENSALQTFSTLDPRSQRIISEALSLDPRPPAAADPLKTYGTTLCGQNIRFTISHSTCHIHSITPQD